METRLLETLSETLSQEDLDVIWGQQWNAGKWTDSLLDAQARHTLRLVAEWLREQEAEHRQSASNYYARGIYRNSSTLSMLAETKAWLAQQLEAAASDAAGREA